MQKWEYKILDCDERELYNATNKRFNDGKMDGYSFVQYLGEQGWELVSVIHRDNIINKDDLRYFFKRPMNN